MTDPISTLPKPRFCTRCGRLLVLETEPSKRFDSKTGQPEPPRRWLTCPRHPRNAFAFAEHYQQRPIPSAIRCDVTVAHIVDGPPERCSNPAKYILRGEGERRGATCDSCTSSWLHTWSIYGPVTVERMKS